MKTLHRLPTNQFAFIDFEFDEDAEEGVNSTRFARQLEAHFEMLKQIEGKKNSQSTQRPQTN